MRKKWILAVLLCVLSVALIEGYLLFSKMGEREYLQAILVTSSLKKDDVIKDSDLQYVMIEDTDENRLKYGNLNNLVGRKALHDMPSGKLIQKSDLLPSKDTIQEQSVVLRLNREQSHKAELMKSEVVSFLCYRQGALLEVENLRIEAVQSVDPTASSSEWYVTVTGEVEKLKMLLLNQQEGVIFIVKKSAVQIP